MMKISSLAEILDSLCSTPLGKFFRIEGGVIALVVDIMNYIVFFHKRFEEPRLQV